MEEKITYTFRLSFNFFVRAVRFSDGKYTEISFICTKLSTKYALRLQYISSTWQAAKACISDI